jgi:hypothetical protein
LNWHAAGNASEYIVYRLSGADFAVIGKTAGTTWYDDQIQPAVMYTYKVSALCGGHETASSIEVTGSGRVSADSVLCRVSWDANRQKAVNRGGGGYRIHYSRRSDFSIELVQDVPFVFGDHSPTSAVLAFNQDQKGLWYVRVTAYSDIGGGKESPVSPAISVTVE